ncbi:MAG: hypothetical protein KQH59_12785 [Desulfobulbaceae bacterium]|nr:hypothetical protein [Desulfobulbaceae bacterium]
MKKNIETIRKKLIKSLKWKVIMHNNNDRFPEILSDEEKKVHEINIPNNTLEIDYLHEIVHAVFIEKYSILFGTSVFAQNVSQSLYELVTPACRRATDWFVDQWLADNVPNEFLKDLENCLYGASKKMLNLKDHGDYETILRCAYIFAQAKKYLNQDIEIKGIFKDAVEAFVSVDPSNPTVEKLQNVINNILACHTDYKVQFIIDESNVQCWKILPVK